MTMCLYLSCVCYCDHAHNLCRQYLGCELMPKEKKENKQRCALA